jgi:hypothetical protein
MNQRVVVPTDKMVKHIAVALDFLDATRYASANKAGRQVMAAEAELEQLRTELLEHPEGITDEMVGERSKDIYRLADPAAEVGGTTHAIWPDAERKAIAHADLYTTGGLLLALQNVIAEADAYESTPYNLRLLAARALIIARRKENPTPSDPLVAPSMVRRDR